MTDSDSITTSNKIDTKHVAITDFETNEDGKLSFQGVDFDSLRAKELRKIATRLKIRGVRNANKEGLQGAIKARISNSTGEDIEIQPTKKQKNSYSTDGGGNIVADVTYAMMRSQLGKQVARYLEQENERKVRAEQRLERESNFNEWERLRTSISKLRNDLRHVENDEANKDELTEDIECLKKRKRELGLLLGYL